MRILLVKPNEQPLVTEIDGSLKSMQDIVGGYIQVFYPFNDNVVFVVNEEGKLDNLPPNREIRDKNGQITDIICGDFFIAGEGEEDFVSLTDAQTIKYTKKFGINDTRQKDSRDKESIKEVNTTPSKTGKEKTRKEER